MKIESNPKIQPPINSGPGNQVPTSIPPVENASASPSKSDSNNMFPGWEKYDMPLDANRPILAQLEEIAIVTQDDELMRLIKRDYYSNPEIMWDQMASDDYLDGTEDEDEDQDE